jgi:hypothetical protein
MLRKGKWTALIESLSLHMSEKHNKHAKQRWLQIDCQPARGKGKWARKEGSSSARHCSRARALGRKTSQRCVQPRPKFLRFVGDFALMLALRALATTTDF